MLNIQENIPLKNYTTLKIGGPASYFVEVKDEAELKEAIHWAKEKGVPYMIIAGGSNLLISDDGYDGLIIKINFSGITQDNDDIIVKAGTPLQELVDFTINSGLDGMSTMSGVPGSVGGAIYGSAGAYGDNIRDHLATVTFFDGNEIKTINRDEYITGYRDSLFKKHKDYVILEARFSGLQPANKEDLKKEAVEIIEKRKEKYPPDTMCPGSFFKNIPVEELKDEQLEQIRNVFVEFNKDPEQVLRFNKVPAGALLEVVGANGYTEGNIMISKNHGNTIMNLGDATAKEFWNVARKWRNEVRNKFCVSLEPEVQFIGFKEEF